MFAKHSASGILLQQPEWTDTDASGLDLGRSKGMERSGLIPRVFGEQNSDGEAVGKEEREESKDSWESHVAVP